MGCGASRDTSQDVVEPSTDNTRDLNPDNGECSQLRANGNFDGDPEDEAAAATVQAAKAVSLIIRACSPVPRLNPDVAHDEDEDEEEKRVLRTVPEPVRHDDMEEDGSSETIVSPVPKSPDCVGSQGVDDLLPKAAAAALEAIVKSAEDDVQAMKVVAAVAAVGDILFGGKEETETKLEKCQTIVKTLAEVDAATINTVLKSEVMQAPEFTPSGAENLSPALAEVRKVMRKAEDEQERRGGDSPKSSFLFDYCQKLGHDYRISSPSTSSVWSSISKADTLSMVQDFLEEIDLTKDYVELASTPRAGSKSEMKLVR